jgi:hypothetical protein
MRGYQEGWRWIPQAGPIHQLRKAIPDYAIASGQTFYRAGFEQGHAVAGVK